MIANFGDQTVKFLHRRLLQLTGSILGLWVLILIAFVLLWAVYPEVLDKQFLAERLKSLGFWAWVIYCAVFIIRGFFLIPSTPFVLLGVLVFPGQEIALFVVSLICVGLNAALIYFFSEKMGFDTYFNSKFPDKIPKIKNALDRWGIPIVVGWSFFPAVPTDLICYVAGVVRMNFGMFMTSILIGEAILLFICIFGLGAALHWPF